MTEAHCHGIKEGKRPLSFRKQNIQLKHRACGVKRNIAAVFLHHLSHALNAEAVNGFILLRGMRNSLFQDQLPAVIVVRVDGQKAAFLTDL